MFGVVIVFGLALALVTSKPSPRIIGGHDVNIEDFPYQISLEHYGLHICGGSIINNIFVLTAAHCVYRLWPDELWVRAGTSILERGGQILGVKAITRHPLYDNFNTNFDIAILKLEEPLIFNLAVQPVRVPAPHQTVPLPVGAKAIISGWGSTKAGNLMSYSEHLQATELSVIDSAQCQKSYGEKLISVYMLCAGVVGGGRDSCKGDSGGPLVVNNELFGIVSWGTDCGLADYPGVYANILTLRDFILYETGI